MPLRKPNTGKQVATGTITVASDGTINVSGLAFSPSTVKIRNNNILAFLAKTSEQVYANVTYNLRGAYVNYGSTQGNALMMGTGYNDWIYGTGFTCKLGVVANQSVTWTAYE